MEGLAALGTPSERTQDRGYELHGSVAVVPVIGTLTKKTYLFACGATYDQVRKGIEAALADHSVKGILLKIDSPGGTVDGCKETADYIHSVRGEKPIRAYADGEICSAAYWLASQCDEIAAPETAQVGSIGVLTVHEDWSKADEEWGVKRTFLTARALQGHRQRCRAPERRGTGLCPGTAGPALRAVPGRGGPGPGGGPRRRPGAWRTEKCFWLGRRKRLG